MQSKIIFFILIFVVAKLQLFGALSGTYTINSTIAASNKNYKNIASAISDLQFGTRTDGGVSNGAGVSAAVIFNLNAEIFSISPITVGSITGTSSAKTITFEGNNRNNCKIKASAGFKAIFFFDNNAAFIKFNNISFEGSQGNIIFKAIGLFMFSGTNINNIEINSCNFKYLQDQFGLSSVFTNCIFFGNEASYNINRGASATNILINQCNFEGAKYAIHGIGYNYSNNTKNTFADLKVENCNFNLIGARAIQLSGISNLIIKKCNFNNANTPILGTEININTLSVGIKTTNGICGNTSEISNNFTNRFVGIFLYFSGDGFPNTDTTKQILIANNAISNMIAGPAYVILAGNTTATSSIKSFAVVLNYAKYCNFYHNSISTNNNKFVALNISNSARIKVKNNSLLAFGFSPAIYLGASNATNEINYNNVYNFTFDTALIYNQNTATFYGEKTFKSQIGNNSVNVNQKWKSALDLHIGNGCEEAPNLGVNYDFDGNYRGSGTDFGAYDKVAYNGNTYYNGNSTGYIASHDVGIVKIENPNGIISSGTITPKVVVKNFGSTASKYFLIYYQIDNNSVVQNYSYYSFNNGCSSMSISLPSFTFSGRMHTIKVWTKETSYQDVNKTNDTMTVTFGAPLNGNYTVGGVNPDFINLKQVEKEVNYLGMDNETVFLLRDGNYNESIELKDIKTYGTSGKFIQFVSQGSNANNVIWTGDNSYNPNLSIINGPNIKVQNITIKAYSEYTNSTIKLTGNLCKQIRIIGCKFIGISNTFQNLIDVGYIKFCNRMVISNCSFTGSIPLNLTDSSVADLYIYNNQFGDLFSGLNVYGYTNIQVLNNTFNFESTYPRLQLNVANVATVNANKFYLDNGDAISVSSSIATATINISNNFIVGIATSNFSTYNLVAGIKINNYIDLVSIVHNTIDFTALDLNYAVSIVDLRNGYPRISIVNNILKTNKSRLLELVVYSNFNLVSNCYYTINASQFAIYSNNVYNDYASFKSTLVNENYSMFSNPALITSGSYQLTPSSAVPTAQYAGNIYDIDGNTRNNSVVTMGCYEVLLRDAQAVTFVNSCGTQSTVNYIKFQVLNAGRSSFYNVTYKLIIGTNAYTVTQNFTSNLAPNSSFTIETPYKIPTGTNNIKVIILGVSSGADENAFNDTITCTVTGNNPTAIIVNNGTGIQNGETYLNEKTKGVGVSVNNLVSNEISGVRIFPNPTKSAVTIKSGMAIYKLEILAANGKLLTVVYNCNSLDLSNFANGIYYLRINNVQIEKVIKN